MPHTDADVREMLAVVGQPELGALFDSIPKQYRLTRPLELPESASEYEILAELEALAAQEQTTTRANAKILEIDDKYDGIVKVNPLLNWTWNDVKKYVKDNNVPYHRLIDQGYSSLGCAPCTRAIKPGEGLRAGRWWWENNESKECGLHMPEERRQ